MEEDHLKWRRITLVEGEQWIIAGVKESFVLVYNHCCRGGGSSAVSRIILEWRKIILERSKITGAENRERIQYP